MNDYYLLSLDDGAHIDLPGCVRAEWYFNTNGCLADSPIFLWVENEVYADHWLFYEALVGLDCLLYSPIGVPLVLGRIKALRVGVWCGDE
jgi:hypothetical protein